MKNKIKKAESAGITLIALVITIIILLILSAISIAMLTGKNSIVMKATNAKEQTERSNIIEEARTEILAIQSNQEGNITKQQFINILNKYFSNVSESLDLDAELTTKKEYGNHTIKPSEIWKGAFSEENPSKPEETIISKYGWKVSNYTTEINKTGGWRLFYQDDEYTYIISDKVLTDNPDTNLGDYKPGSYTSEYPNGSSVSEIGKKLNPMINSLFIETNTNPNITATAFLTDPDRWSKFKSTDAEFAIASPTVELFAKSYNQTHTNSNQLICTFETYGYKTNCANNWLVPNEFYGIYNINSSLTWWLSSPGSAGNNRGLYVFEGMGNINFYNVNNNFGDGCSIRPVVAIPTSTFNSQYASSLVNE